MPPPKLQQQGFQVGTAQSRRGFPLLTVRHIHQVQVKENRIAWGHLGGLWWVVWTGKMNAALGHSLVRSDHEPHQSSSTSVIAVDAARTKHTNVDKNQPNVMIDLVNNILLLRRTVVSVLPTSRSMLDWDSKDSSRSRHTVAVLHLTISQLHCVEGG